MYYDEPVYRPPSEAGSLLIQATTGCAHATCSYCVSSVSGKFSIRPLAEIEADLKAARQTLGPGVGKIFLLAQNAFIMPAGSLVELSHLAYELFPGLQQVSLYAHPHDILSKTPAELESIYRSGVKLLYIGLESGDDEVLRRVGKRLSAEKSILACRQALAAGFRLSCTVIIGLGGKELTRQHATATGRMISAISPHYLGCLTLLLPPGTLMQRRVSQGTFELLTTAGSPGRVPDLTGKYRPPGEEMRLPGQSRFQLSVPGGGFARRPGEAGAGSDGGQRQAGGAPFRKFPGPPGPVGPPYCQHYLFPFPSSIWEGEQTTFIRNRWAVPTL